MLIITIIYFWEPFLMGDIEVKSQIFKRWCIGEEDIGDREGRPKIQILKMDITLPKLKYKMGKEPMSGFKAIY
ncbi:unnamed protein product [Thlaspi arvense]|uniref:Uncharacterized protein n=1 Tax=Thlaspi arvense TaxID=13288 RepID=A0AAU9RQL5_THLAR|nr:unnamed protein product [Thlaspi arvense]